MSRGRRWLLAIVAMVLLIVVTAGAGAWVVQQRIDEPFKAWSGPEAFVEIPPGTNPRAIERRLREAGIVRDDWTFRAALLVTGRAQLLKAGEYRFDSPASARAVIERLARGDIYLRLFTVPEGLTIMEMARAFEAGGFGTADAFISASRNPALIRDLDPDADDLEGYLYPESYALPRNAPATVLIERMVAQFKRAFDEGLQAKARAEGLTVRQVVTLASLVEEETARSEERGLVAAVYRNRMRIGMGMQADPTVIFALQRAGRYDGNISRSDLQFDSPYNTYRYPGLPPGPIAAPSRASIEAAISPADAKYLYFVSRNDGSHVFAETLEAHNRNVYEWQIKYFRR